TSLRNDLPQRRWKRRAHQLTRAGPLEGDPPRRSLWLPASGRAARLHRMFVRPRTVARRWLRRAAPRLRAVLLGLIAPSLFALACRGRESGEPAFVAELARELVAGEVTRAGIE